MLYWEVVFSCDTTKKNYKKATHRSQWFVGRFPVEFSSTGDKSLQCALNDKVLHCHPFRSISLCRLAYVLTYWRRGQTTCSRDGDVVRPKPWQASLYVLCSVLCRGMRDLYYCLGSPAEMNASWTDLDLQLVQPTVYIAQLYAYSWCHSLCYQAYRSVYSVLFFSLC